MKYLLALFLVLSMTQTSMSETIRLEPEVKVNDYREVFMPYIEWITANSTYTYNGEPMPRVAFVSKGILQTVVYGADNVAKAEAKGVKLLEVLAAYDKGVMYFPRDKDIASFEMAPTVLHELVHYLQGINKTPDYGCLQNLEPPAYELQTKWMDAHNHPEERPSPFFIMMLTYSCSRPPWDK
jgi:hypothetical protein